MKSGTDPFDLMRSTWCKSVLKKFGENCCPIFDYIKSVQGDIPWGSILDAGTGGHSLDWIINQEPESWTAITGDIRRQKQMEDWFSGKIRKQDKVITGNWRDANLLKGEVFDVVIADYLVGSLDAFSPYFQDKIFERLKPHVGKRLYITGAEPIPDKAEGNPHGTIVIEVCKVRDACILLAGERPYREFPLDLILRYLSNAGFSIEGVGFFETTYSVGFIEKQIEVAKSKLYKIENQQLAESLKQHIKDLNKRVRKLKWGISFGSDYVVVASPKQKKEKEEVKVEVFKPDYVSKIQEQKDIFPLDELDT